MSNTCLNKHPGRQLGSGFRATWARPLAALLLALLAAAAAAAAGTPPLPVCAPWPRLLAAACLCL